MTAARSRRAGRGRKVTQGIKRGTTRTAAAKAREFASMSPDKEPKPKAAQTGTSRKARRDAPKPEQGIKRGTTRTRQPRAEKEVVPGTTRVRKTADGSKKTKPTLNKQGAAGFAAGLDAAGKRKTAKKAAASKVAAGSNSSKPTTTVKPEKKKDKEKKTLFGLEIKPSSRFAGKGGKGRRVAGRAMGGMMKSKMASKGGAKGGRMPTGMKRGGSLEMTMVGGRKVPAFAADGKGANDLAKKQAGGMMKSKGMAKGGAMKKKGYAMGGPVKKKGMAKGGAMKKKGYAMGGMTKKGMAKGGAMTKKGMAKGGSVRKTTKPRGVGAALRGYGKAMKK